MSLYNFIHGPEIWLGIAILGALGAIVCLIGLIRLIRQLHKEDEHDS